MISIEWILPLASCQCVCVSEDDKEFPVYGHVALEFA